MTPFAGVLRVMCPGGETGAGLAPACWPDQKPVRLVGRDPSQSCRARFPPQPRSSDDLMSPFRFLRATGDHIESRAVVIGRRSVALTDRERPGASRALAV